MSTSKPKKYQDRQIEKSNVIDSIRMFHKDVKLYTVDGKNKKDVIRSRYSQEYSYVFRSRRTRKIMSREMQTTGPDGDLDSDDIVISTLSVEPRSSGKSLIADCCIRVRGPTGARGGGSSTPDKVIYGEIIIDGIHRPAYDKYDDIDYIGKNMYYVNNIIGNTLNNITDLLAKKKDKDPDAFQKLLGDGNNIILKPANHVVMQSSEDAEASDADIYRLRFTTCLYLVEDTENTDKPMYYLPNLHDVSNIKAMTKINGSQNTTTDVWKVERPKPNTFTDWKISGIPLLHIKSYVMKPVPPEDLTKCEEQMGNKHRIGDIGSVSLDIRLVALHGEGKPVLVPKKFLNSHNNRVPGKDNDAKDKKKAMVFTDDL